MPPFVDFPGGNGRQGIKVVFVCRGSIEAVASVALMHSYRRTPEHFRFLGSAETLQLFVFTQFRTENRYTLIPELL
ncbi:hypothetical protein CYK37_22415 [Mesorhizobium loti]|nr:hypothetical protein CYK37_22415 [Mesorhizobium loti]